MNKKEYSNVMTQGHMGFLPFFNAVSITHMNISFFCPIQMR